MPLIFTFGFSSAKNLGSSYNFPFRFNYVVSANIGTGINVRTLAVAAGWNGVDPLLATVTINTGIGVGTPTSATPAFNTGTPFSKGSSITLINNGIIYGWSGTGGGGGQTSKGSPGSSGAAGGPALTASVKMNITNNGVIAGGGNGGTGGTSGPTTPVAGGGTGGRGAGSQGVTFYATGQAGSPGGAGAGSGSAGFALGVNGACTTTGSNALINWVVAGTRTGALG